MTRFVVDAANVVGSVPDGWWRDRPGAARRLLDRLADRLESATSSALPAGAGVEVVVVLEGQARAAAPAGAYRSLVVLHAPSNGDDALVAAASEAPERSVVVTSDRELRRRVEALGARTIGPRALDDLVLRSATSPGEDAGDPPPPGEAATVSDTENPRQNVTFASNGDEAHGYLAKPASGRGPGVIVIQEWWGLTDHIADIADRLAAEGFVALAPDLFGGRVAHDADEAGKLMSSLPEDQAARDLAGAVDFLLAGEDVEGESLATIGFCMGGGFVLALAVQQGDKISAAVPFYGVGAVPQDFTGLTAAVQGHYGLKDDFYPAEQAKALEAQIREQSGAEVEFHYYEAAHAFHNDEDKLGTYSPDDAKVAWQRTVDFLRAHTR